jgi:hypothetical protein
MSKFIVGSDVEQPDLDDLREQGNTAWAACGGPLFMAGFEVVDGYYSELELPAFPGLRAIKAAGFTNVTSGSSSMDLTLTDDTGAMGTTTIAETDGMIYNGIEWTRPQDGRITIRVGGTVGTPTGEASLGIFPAVPSLSMSGMGGDGYLHTDRTEEDRGLSTGAANVMFDQVANGEDRPQVFKTHVEMSPSRITGGGSVTFCSLFPITSRGHKIGISCQGKKSGVSDPTVTLVVDGQEVDLTITPTVQGTILRGTTTNPVPSGWIFGDVQVTVPTGSTLDIYSLAVYEEIG